MSINTQQSPLDNPRDQSDGIKITKNEHNRGYNINIKINSKSVLKVLLFLGCIHLSGLDQIIKNAYYNTKYMLQNKLRDIKFDYAGDLGRPAMDCTNIVTFNEAFASARAEGHKLFIWRNQVGVLEEYTTDYLEEKIAGVEETKTNIEYRINSFFLDHQSRYIISQSSGISGNTLGSLIMQRNLDQTLQQTIAMQSSTQTLTVLLKEYNYNSANIGGKFDPMEGSIYAEFNNTSSSYLHEKLHSIDIGNYAMKKKIREITEKYTNHDSIIQEIVKINLDTIPTISTSGTMPKLLQSILDTNKGYEKSYYTYITHPNEIFVRFFGTFYYREQHLIQTHHCDDPEAIYRPDDLRKPINQKEFVAFYKSLPETNDCKQLLTICDLEKVISLMNSFYGY